MFEPDDKQWIEYSELSMCFEIIEVKNVRCVPCMTELHLRDQVYWSKKKITSAGVLSGEM